MLWNFVVGHGDNNESNETTTILILLKNKFIGCLKG